MNGTVSVGGRISYLYKSETLLSERRTGDAISGAVQHKYIRFVLNKKHGAVKKRKSSSIC